MNKHGAWWNTDEDSLIVSLGASWTRVSENKFGASPWDGHSEKAALYKAVGIKICLTLIWDDDGTIPPTTNDYEDLRAYVNEVMDDVGPDMVSFGNEILSQAFWADPSTPVTSYLAAATAVGEECAARGIPFLAGAIHSRLLYGAYRWHLAETVSEQAADDFAAAIADNSSEETAMNGIGFSQQKDLLLEPYLTGLAATGASYVLFHIYEEEYQYLDEIIDWIEDLSGLPALTDEWGLFVQDANVVAGTLEVLERRCDLAIAFSMNIWTDPYDATRTSQMLNVAGTETLTTNGQAFSDFLAALSLPSVEAVSLPATSRSKAIEKQLPYVKWLIDDKEIPVADDWVASTIAHGGYDSASLKVPESFSHRFPSLFGPGVRVSAFQQDGVRIWEGDIANAPTADNGIVEVFAAGGNDAAEMRDENLLYQDDTAGEWRDENGAPHNGTGKANIVVTSGDGLVSFEIGQDETVAQNEKHGLVRWIAGSKIRRIRGTLLPSGTYTGYKLRIETCDGPAGTRSTAVDVDPGAGLLDETIVSPTDMVVLSLVKTSAGTETRPNTLKLEVRDLRINDLTLADGFDISNVIADIGQRLGYDTTGVDLGVPLDYVGGALITWDKYQVKVATGLTTLLGPRYTLEERSKMTLDRAAVLESALDALPFFWTGGSWANALSYLCELIDWRWLVLGNTFGRGRLLDAGPFGPSWSVSPQGARVQLREVPPDNQVVVKWTSVSGSPMQTIVRADPNPLEQQGKINSYPFTLADPQPDESLALALANSLIATRSQPRVQGRIDLYTVRDLVGPSSPYEVTAGSLVSVDDWGNGNATDMRVKQTEMRADGVSLGIEQDVSLVNLIAAGLRRSQRPLGVLRRYVPLDRWGGTDVILK